MVFLGQPRYAKKLITSVVCGLASKMLHRLLERFDEHEINIDSYFGDGDLSGGFVSWIGSGYNAGVTCAFHRMAEVPSSAASG